MKTLIAYVSTHQGNTKKLVDSIAEKNDITMIDVTKLNSAESSKGESISNSVDLAGYDLIGFASGIAYSKFYPQMLKFMEENLPKGKKTFLLYTFGSRRQGYTDAARQIISSKGCEVLGEYGCLGFDTYGPLKLIGGIAKGHPTADEIAGAAAFYDSLK